MNLLIEVTPLDALVKTGIGTYVDGVCRALLRSGTTDRLQFWGPDLYSDPFPEFTNKRFLGHDLFPRSVQEEFWFQAGMGGLPIDADVFHITSAYFPPPRRHGKPKIVSTIHDLAFAYYPESLTEARYFRFLNECLSEQAQRSDRIIVDSASTGHDVHTILGVPEAKIRVIYLGCDLQHPESEGIPDPVAWAELSVPEKYILCVGTWEPRKNLPNLFRAMQRLRTKCQENHIKLCIAGRKGWMYTEAEELIDAMDIRDILQPLGYVPRSLLPTLYNRAMAFVYPSFYEGFGLPVLEAMACGAPVITSNVSSLPEVAGDAGLLIDPDSVDELAGAIERVIDEPLLRQELVEKGYRQAARFSWERAAREHLEVYHEA